MRKSSARERRNLCIAGAAALVAAPACSEPGFVTIVMAGAAPVIQRNKVLALGLYQRLKKQLGNLGFPPYTVPSLLAMAFTGARGKAKAEMASLIRFDIAAEVLPLTVHLLLPLCCSSAIALEGARPGEGISRSEGLAKPDTPLPAAADEPATESYEEKASRFVLQEANQVASELGLAESLPIREGDLVEMFIAPRRSACRHRGIGTVTTSNYVYCVSIGNKFSYIIGKHQLEDCVEWEKDYLWPISRLDTNGAYQVASQWLTAISMDVEALNRDYRLFIDPDKIYVRAPPGKFVPVYWVGWYKKHKPDPNIMVSHPTEWESVASVFLFAPTKTLLQLRVEDPKYILRKPLQFTNAGFSLGEPPVRPSTQQIK